MSDRVLIPLPGIGTLSLAGEQYEALIGNAPAKMPREQSACRSLVSAKSLSAALSLPLSCIYENAKAGRIPSVRVGRHARFHHSRILAALKSPGTATVGHA